ncbi:probable pectinesterase/pectinesterase inhibitor 12 [Asparagus officinalis]|uniref:probable pectinesterase/pectinesterase inhibitor 12 n=1 Tax=Asparagus officinalis TaxID=4686 RepID=UPI00098E36B2|nr:probable pectinesterase/pectinesterase inhibitor 12 [Asparagus officinalis]
MSRARARSNGEADDLARAPTGGRLSGSGERSGEELPSDLARPSPLLLSSAPTSRSTPRRPFPLRSRRRVVAARLDLFTWPFSQVPLRRSLSPQVIASNKLRGLTFTISSKWSISDRDFIAQDICFKNTAGASKGQVVALRVDVGFVAFYRCAIDGYQDTLYARYGQQFYQECNISGTISFIFGDASAVFQNFMIYAKLLMQKQCNIFTAQGRESESEATCFSMQNCSILPWHELAASNGLVKTYLGRPWRNF